MYVCALEQKNIEVILGAFRAMDRTCRTCHKTYQTYEEKQTDVNIAIKLLETAVLDEWDIAFIVSGSK